MHPLLDEILASAKTELPDGSPTALTSAISREACELVYRMIALCGATSAVEVGMAFCISTLAIADALSQTPAARLVSIDPHQSTGWGGAGMHLIGRAGLAHIVTLIEETSQQALPRLAANGERFDFAFIDGWHTFDHTLVDFFFADALLKPGGIVMLDDLAYPAIRRVAQFILANRDYELLEVVGDGEVVPRGLRARRALKRVMRPLARTDRDPSSKHERMFRGIDGAQVAALRKRGDDRRRFDHFERF
jgi:predicted O-methyltransferase YrrM